MTNILRSKEFLNRFWVIIFIVLGLLSHNPLKIAFFLASGVLTGLYYGCYNDIIWRPNPKEKLSEHIHYRAHQMWIHILCAVVGSIALYFLTTIINFNNPKLSFDEYGFNLFILSFIVVMAYVGLLPRLLWYTSYGLGQFGKPPGK